MREVAQGLRALSSAITRISNISGTPGVSVGVLHHGEVVHTANFGYRDVEAKLAPDEDTIYHIASLSKLITAAGIGILVDDQNLSWKSPISSILPGFNHKDPVITKEANSIDLLAHMAGVASQNQFIMQEYGRLSLSQQETLPIFSSLPQIAEFRSTWNYCNWHYGVAAMVVERISGISWGDFLKTRIFDPLGLKRTITIRNPMTPNSQFDNVARGYIALEDGSPLLTERPYVSSGTLFSGAAGVQSSVNDLLRLYQTLLASNSDQSIKNSPFRQLSTLFSAHIPIPGYSVNKKAYSLGLVRTELPGSLGVTGLNSMSVSEMPVVGRGGGPKIVYHHNGSLAAFLACVILIPESQSVIVVLTNSIAKNDCADWIAQMLLEELIDCPEKNDYEHIAQTSADDMISKWNSMPVQLEEQRIPNTLHRSIEQYAGGYFNSIGDYYLDIFVEDGELFMCMQGDRTQTYKLNHYHNDTFSWLLTWDENAHRGRFRVPSPEYYLLRFQAQDESIYAIKWSIDPDIPNGQLFSKQDDAGLEQIRFKI
ncbi:hypothetical protein HO133_004284 [Letharia lupina]|uniref:Beta-lactamase/transpeptidase-like protein n=1 Tax=Letharia lupina TaxID=560253 RepID=A0A8H6FK32_9LECA|nr:uncharacterized protein HO133_004284 [Letharia lupina]KAF6229947.1 hypothetical protein HO133_004284 [Letharia lupina]